MKKFKVFLASSVELSLERKEIALMISRLNNAWVDKGIYLELVIWEDLLQSFRGERIQDYFNREMLKCDIVLVLFFKKVGQFTKEEFDKAYENLKKGKKPHFLFVYFKTGTIALDEVDEEILKINQLKKEIQRYMQIYNTFNSIENLTEKFSHQLELSIFETHGKPGLGKEAENLEKQQDELENYKQYVKQKFQYLDFTGLNTILQKPLKLEKIYVRLRTQKFFPFKDYRSIYESKRLAEEDVENLLASDLLISIYEEEKQAMPVEDFVAVFKKVLEESLEQGHSPRLLILGHPGSGKTTLLKWIALQCQDMSHSDHLFSDFIPVFIPLKELNSHPGETFRKRNISSLVIHLLERENVSVASFLDFQLRANKLLFLLDGLDEIGDEKIRREVIDWIQRQYIGQNPLVITSRFSGIHEKSGLKFPEEVPVFAIQDFEMEDVEAFLQNWYSNIEIAVAGETDIQRAIDEGEGKYKDLINTIKTSKNLTELAVNPLLLTIIAIVHRTRAVLPRGRYKLYEECLKVMIELWNLANRKIDINFSFENSMAHLSKIARQMMETNHRELGKEEIESCLPAKIEGQQRDFFLKEMVLKAGLLYKSGGKYGFLHFTFHEYLAAWHFAKSKNQNDILRFYDKDYWKETFKLFVNIGNSELLFEEVIDNLLKRDYWNKMTFWEECIEEIVVEEAKNIIEIRFANKVVDILMELEYKKENNDLIDVLYLHCPLYKHGKQLVNEGWDLFYNAPHPFVQSIGTSILSGANDKARAELMNQLKNRINDFEKQKDDTSGNLLYFLLQNNNAFILHFAGSQNITDLNFALGKLKSGNLFLQYLSLIALVYIWYILDICYILDIRRILNIQDNRGIRGILDIRDVQGILDILDIRYILDIRLIRDIRDIRDILDIQGIRDIRDIRDIRGILDIRDILYIPYLSKILNDYTNKYKKIIARFQKEIADWTDRTIEKLHNQSDEKLLKYFPNTTKEELKAFRESKK